MRLLYYAPTSRGGLADYAAEQATALARLGIEVQMLVPTNYKRRPDGFDIRPMLLPSDGLAASALKRRVQLARSILENVRMMRKVVLREQHTHVLFGAFSEYLAPLWSAQLRKLRDKGVVFGAVIHDPVRDYVVGPRWWHRYCIASAYSFLREGFLHEAIDVDTVRSMPRLRTTVVPHGPYGSVAPTKSREAVRVALGIPSHAPIMLAFGHIRDAKNLDLVLRAMVALPRVYLIVAGTEQSSRQKPATHYQRLASELGVANRCRWLIDYIVDSEVANLFLACDLILLAYSTAFRSASGVQNLAASYERICVVSAGNGNLRSVVDRYKLGVVVDPNDVESLRNGILSVLDCPPQPRWDDYRKDNSWRRNAELVLEAFQDRDD